MSGKKYIVIEADKYLGMKIGKARRAETCLQRLGCKTEVVKRDARYGEDRYAVRVTFGLAPRKEG